MQSYRIKIIYVNNVGLEADIIGNIIYDSVTAIMDPNFTASFNFLPYIHINKDVIIAQYYMVYDREYS